MLRPKSLWRTVPRNHWSFVFGSYRVDLSLWWYIDIIKRKFNNVAYQFFCISFFRIHNDATRYWIFIFKVLFKVIKWLWLITITLTFCLQSICLIVLCIAVVQGPWIKNLYVKCRLYFVGKAACILKSWLMQNYFFVVWYKVRFVSLPSFLLILSNNYRILLMMILTYM